MSISTTLPVIALDRRQAKTALANIDALQPEAPAELDYQGCVLIALRGRLRDRDREVPSEIWPELEQWLAESPGLMTPVYPSRRYAGRKAVELAMALMAFHVWALFTPGMRPMTVLVAEGLLNGLMAEPYGLTVVGDHLLRVIDAVLEEFGEEAA